MVLNMSPILLLNGLVPVVLSLQPVAPTLYFITDAVTWPAARDYCRTVYSDLAPVKTYSDVSKINQIASANSWSAPIWVGLYNDVTSWRWSFHDLPLSAIALRKWNPGEPSDTMSNEECVFLKSTGLWYDKPCSLLYPFICYNAQYLGDGRFVGVTTPMTWTDAQTYCRSFHTDLATALDEADNTVLQQVAAAQGDSWFGLYRDGWTWTDQTKARNIYWGPGNPDNWYGNEYCVRYYLGSLDDMTCTNLYRFICHYIPPIKRKVLKVQVKSDQVFDAAVQSALLAKIVQKLEQHGMLKDVTVTWRVRPDGNVFYKKK